ncbi:hypothetical protein [Nocardioides albus]|uniref:Cytoskeletal protein RodZ n=1 Tax=Nocardioides albus TaxID=1841 RepID=A0A7W5A2H8_9ACTN|nr:hypothetical protein [Nocardioides albus]MBB3088487.1 cytoskeletal protein RodZ [Nocardioides albus]GGU16634.1 hypothetical protein GCM10007979_13760 [Nocardioides albus]
MKWPLLLALIAVLAVLIWFFFGRPIRKGAKTPDRAEKDHSSPETTSAPVAAVAVPAEASVTETAAEATDEPETIEADVTDVDTAAVVAEAESVTAAAAAETTADEPTAADTEAPAAEETTAAPVDTEPEVAPVAEAPAATDGAPYAGAVLPAADGSSSDAAYDIKGSSGKKYHTPASPYYTRTKAAVYFDSEESAEAAGFIAGFKKKVDA